MIVYIRSMQSVQSKRDSASPLRTDAALIRTRNNRMPPSYPNLRTASTRIKQSQSADRGWEVWRVGRRERGGGGGSVGGRPFGLLVETSNGLLSPFFFCSCGAFTRNRRQVTVSTSPCPHHRVTGWRKLSKDAVYRGKGAQ